MTNCKVIGIAIVVLFGTAASVSAETYVNGYYRQNGTYVQPHHQTSPDANRYNNWSTQGNVNPYTGQPGTVNPYRQPQPYQNQWHQQRNNSGYR